VRAQHVPHSLTGQVPSPNNRWLADSQCWHVTWVNYGYVRHYRFTVPHPLSLNIFVFCGLWSPRLCAGCKRRWSATLLGNAHPPTVPKLPPSGKVHEDSGGSGGEATRGIGDPAAGNVPVPRLTLPDIACADVRMCVCAHRSQDRHSSRCRGGLRRDLSGREPEGSALVAGASPSPTSPAGRSRRTGSGGMQGIGAPFAPNI
jgi:hypothetical protein